MNTQTGHLATVDFLDTLPAAVRERYTPVPSRLLPDAAAVLGDKPAAHIDLGGGSPLARWAGEVRTQRGVSVLSSAGASAGIVVGAVGSQREQELERTVTDQRQVIEAQARLIAALERITSASPA